MRCCVLTHTHTFSDLLSDLARVRFVTVLLHICTQPSSYQRITAVTNRVKNPEGRGRDERRYDADGSGPYTKREFVDEYGGYAEWDAATPA